MHVGIIMDGNRRWAKKNGKSTVFGYTEGKNNIIRHIEIFSNKKIQYLTLWALSKENIEKRDIKEISLIVSLIDSIYDVFPKLKKFDIRFETIGNLELFPEKTKNLLNKLKKDTIHHSKIVLTLALAYSGQDEIIRATKKIIHSKIDINSLNEKIFRKYLDTCFLPQVDLIIRTGGENRHSGFLLFDSAYSEYYFSNKFWPEFDEEEFNKALDFFYNKKRNFGK